MKTFEQHITVTNNDLDELQHVNNVRYVQWIQDVAKGHWEAVAPKDFTDTFIWVVAAHHIYYKGECFLNDQLRVKTFIESSHGVLSNRKVEIYKKDTDKLILTATTEWCLVNTKTKRPARIPKEIEDLFL